MPRRARISLPGVSVHLQRASNRGQTTINFSVNRGLSPIVSPIVSTQDRYGFGSTAIPRGGMRSIRTIRWRVRWEHCLP